jgi:hypothetical protein
LASTLPSTIPFLAGGGSIQIPGAVDAPAALWRKVAGTWQEAATYKNVQSNWDRYLPRARIKGLWRPTPPTDSPELRSTGLMVDGTTSGPSTADLPTDYRINDVLVMAVFFKDASATVTTPSGWTRVSGTFTGPNSQIIYFFKYAAASETAPTLTYSTTGAGMVSQIAAFKNANLTNPVVGAGPSSSFATAFETLGPITGRTTAAFSTVVVAAMRGNDWVEVDPLVGDGLPWGRIGEVNLFLGGVWDWAPTRASAGMTVNSKTFTLSSGSGSGDGVGVMLELAARSAVNVLPFTSTLRVYLDPDDLDGSNNTTLTDRISPASFLNKGTLGGTFASNGAPRFTRSGGVNNRPGIYFDGAGWLTSSLAASSFAFLNDVGGYTVYAVWRAVETSPTADRRHILLTTAVTPATAGSRGFTLAIDDRLVGLSRDNVLVHACSDGTVLNASHASNNNAAQAPFNHLLTAMCHGTGGNTFSTFVDGGLVQTSALAGSRNSTSPDTRLAIGATTTGIETAFGVLSALLIYEGGHTDQQREIVKLFLDDKLREVAPSPPKSTWPAASGTIVASLGTATPQTLNYPNNTVPGDFLLGVISQRAISATFTTPPGWTRVPGSFTTGLGQFALIWKVAGPGESSVSVDFVGASAHTFLSQLFALKGIHPTNPIVQVGTPGDFASAATVGPISGLTIQDTNVAIVVGWRPGQWTGVDVLTGDVPWVKMSEANTAVGGDASFTLQYGQNLTGVPLTISNKTVTVTGAATDSCGVMLELRSVSSTS